MKTETSEAVAVDLCGLSLLRALTREASEARRLQITNIGYEPGAI